MSVKLPLKKNLCGTAEAAKIFGCSQQHIRHLASTGEIWSEQISPRICVYDANEVKQLAAEKAKLRKLGKLCGRRPGVQKTA